MSLIGSKSNEQYTKSVADFLPAGKLWASKGKYGTNLYALLAGLGTELPFMDSKFNEIADEHQITQTTNLIEQWESAVGIPNDYIDIAPTLAQRRDNVLLMVAASGTQTVADFEWLAAQLGVTCTITQGVDKFTIVVTFLGITAPNVWPWNWPLVWGIDPAENLRSMFDKLKPANCQVLYYYVP